MAECRDFFEDSATGSSRSSSLGDGNSPPNLRPHGKEGVGSHCLDLTLGPSNFYGSAVSPPDHHQQHDMVRVASAYSLLQRQPSGNFVSSLPATTHTSHSSPVQTDGFKVSSAQHDAAAALGRQRSGNYACGENPLLTFGHQGDATLPVKALLPAGSSAFPSRDQIWQTLQKSGTLFEHTQHSDDASPMWSRRATSMQVVFPRNGVDDMEHLQIRRSCSNGVLTHALSSQFSNIDSTLERIPQQIVVSPQQPQQDSLEDLQKRKELQAQRRLEARKRRKILIEEKQHKKGKQSNSLVLEKVSQGGAPSGEGEDDAAPESHCMSPDDLKSARSIDTKIGMSDLRREEMRQETQQDSKSNSFASSNEEVERLSQNMQVEGGKSNVSVHAYGSAAKQGNLNFMSNEHNSDSHGCLTSGEVEQSGLVGKCSVSNSVLLSSNGHNHCKPVFEVEGAKPSPSSEITDSLENSSARKDVGGDVRGMVSASYSSSPIGCPPLLFSPIQYAYAAAGRTTTAVSNQPGHPIPYFMKYPAAGNCENNPLMQSLPNVRGASPSVTNTFGGTFPLSSGASFLSRTSSGTKDFAGDSEGKQGSSERSAFLSLPRTASNSKHVFEEPQYSSTRLEFQVSLTGSQLSSTSNVMFDASHNKKLLLERQPSRPLGGRLLSQNSSIEDQAFLSSRQERAIPGQSGFSVPCEAPTFRLGKPNLRLEEGVKQEEGSSESQLASEHSGVDASYVQSGVIEKQKSGSLSNLPWVTTTGKGPNGKTINGVMYIENGRHVRLVCSCHGKHMSPVEFVEHSGSSDLSNPERKIVVSPSPHLNHQVASTAV